MYTMILGRNYNQNINNLIIFKCNFFSDYIENKGALNIIVIIIGNGVDNLSLNHG